MNEQLIVHISELSLTIAALFGIITVLSATWYDLRSIKRKKQARQREAAIAKRQPITYDSPTIRALPYIFKTLNRNILHKAFAWLNLRHTARHTQPRTRFRRSALPLALRVAQTITLMAFIGLSTYFFTTAATLQSSTLLTLSWAGVSLWLVAIIWSDDVLKLSKKIELSFTVPFMYFIFYIYAFIMVMRNIKLLLFSLRLPKLNIKALHTAIWQEAYSTRF